MSMLCSLPGEIFDIIINYYNIKHKQPTSELFHHNKIISLRLVCKQFKNTFNFMIQKIMRLDRTIYLFNKKLSFSTMLSLCTNSTYHYGHYNYYKNIIKYCVNNNCCYKNAKISNHKGFVVLKRKNHMAGMLHFYYPKDLELPHDDENDPYGTNHEYRFRLGQCLDGPRIKRFIPYCFACMHKFCYIERRSDGQLTPYGDSDCCSLFELPLSNNITQQ